ncbi:ciliary microtubule associated protein 1A-like [Anableps anableps]
MKKDDPWVGTWRPHRPRGLIAAQYVNPGPKYLLPGLTGATHHDPTKPKAPAYSLSARFKVANTNLSPGPKYMLPCNFTRYGKDGTPAFSIHGRSKLPALFRTPGPGQYFPENSKKSLFRTTPAYSLSARRRDSSKRVMPGPATYTLPSIIGTNDTTSPAAPSYSLIGRRQKGTFYEDLKKTPGPAAYNAADLYMSKTRPPQCTIKGRNFLPDKRTKTPGPGAHYPERTTCTKPKAPILSFGLRHSDYTVPLIANVDDCC